MSWREYFNLLAVCANVLLVVFLLGTRSWFWPIGFGVPLIMPPLLALIAFTLNRRTRN